MNYQSRYLNTRTHSCAIQFSALVRSKQLSRSVSVFLPRSHFRGDSHGDSRSPKRAVCKNSKTQIPKKFRSMHCLEVIQKSIERPKRKEARSIAKKITHSVTVACPRNPGELDRRYVRLDSIANDCTADFAPQVDPIRSARCDAICKRDHAITRSRAMGRGNARAALRATARNQLWLLDHLVVPPPTATPSRGGLALCTRLARTDYGGDP